MCASFYYGEHVTHTILGLLKRIYINTTTECIFVIRGMIVTKRVHSEKLMITQSMIRIGLLFNCLQLKILVISMWRPDKGHTSELNLYGARTLTSFTFATNYSSTT